MALASMRIESLKPTWRHGRNDMTWIQTYSGVQFWPFSPRVEDVRLEDIANGLALKCRFTGQCREFYSIAQHSVLVAQLLMTRGVMHGAGMETRKAAFRAALLHDAAEAYLPDIASPIKPAWEEFKAIESRVLRCIHKALDVWPFPDVERSIKHCDNVLLATEARDLMGPLPQRWAELPEPWGVTVTPVSPEAAKKLWLASWGEG
jgi:hypothetical protein